MSPTKWSARHARDLLDGISETNLVSVAFEDAGERVRHLLVQEPHQRRPSLDDGDACAERAEDAGVLAADDAAADDGEGFRDAIELQDGVGILDVAVLERHARRAQRRAAGRDKKHAGGEPALRLTRMSRVVHGDFVG